MNWTLISVDNACLYANQLKSIAMPYIIPCIIICFLGNDCPAAVDCWQSEGSCLVFLGEGVHSIPGLCCGSVSYSSPLIKQSACTASSMLSWGATCLQGLKALQYLFNGHNKSIINESCDVSTVIGVQSDLFSQTVPPVAIRRIAGLRQLCISFSNL